MAGVDLYALSPPMVTGPRIRSPTIRTRQKAQHPQAGNITGSWPSLLNQKKIPLSNTDTTESPEHEQKAVEKYKELLEEVVDASIMLEEYAQTNWYGRTTRTRNKRCDYGSVKR